MHLGFHLKIKNNEIYASKEKNSNIELFGDYRISYEESLVDECSLIAVKFNDTFIT